MLVRTVQHLNVTFLGDAIFLPTRIKWFAGKSSSLLCVTRIPCHHTPTGFPKAKATSQVQDDPRPSHSTPRKFSFRELLDDRLAHRPHSLFSGKALWELEMLLWQTQRGEKIRSVSTTCTRICMESSLVALFCSFSISCNILCSSCCFDTIVSVSLLCKLWISLSLATSLFCTSAAETSGF